MTLDNHKRNKFLFIFDDAVMMTALLLNLLLLGLEWLYSYKIVQNGLAVHVPAVFNLYTQHVHRNFLLIDMGFVLFFLMEFVISWIIAVRKKWYDEWFYYPFVHLYDLLGCIPVGTLRLLRVLRVISILFRLQKLGVIDLRKTAIYSRLKRLYDIALEEISDRVVIKVLGSVQQRIISGGGVADRVVDEVLLPCQPTFSRWMSSRLSTSLTDRYAERQLELRRYVQNLIGESFKRNENVELMKAIPMVGTRVSDILEAMISDIVLNIVDKGIKDLTQQRCETLINESLDLAVKTVYRSQDKESIKQECKRLIVDIIDMLKDQVRVKRWKETASG